LYIVVIETGETDMTLTPDPKNNRFLIENTAGKTLKIVSYDPAVTFPHTQSELARCWVAARFILDNS